MIRKQLQVAGWVGGVLLFLAGGAAAEPTCRAVHAIFTLEVVEGPGCASPIGLCAAGSYRGSLRGTSEFTGSSFVENVDTAATGVVTVTGDNVIHTASGDLFTKDAIVLALTGDGEFAEVDTVVGGTDAFAGASGRLVGTGTFSGTGGQGILVGEICSP